VCAHYCIYYIVLKSKGFTMSDIESSFSDDKSFNDWFVHAFVCININRWLNYLREHCRIIASIMLPHFYRINETKRNNMCSCWSFPAGTTHNYKAINNFDFAIHKHCTITAYRHHHMTKWRNKDFATDKHKVYFALLQLTIIIAWLSDVIMLMYTAIK